MQDIPKDRRLSGPPHPPKVATQDGWDSCWKSTVSFTSPVECTLDDQLLDPRRMRAEAKAERGESERGRRRQENCVYRDRSNNRYDALMSPNGDTGDVGGRVWGADESRRIGTLADSPKPRRNNGPKGAIRRLAARDQPMETMDGDVREQASARRREDAREDLRVDGSMRGGAIRGGGVTDVK